MSFPGEIWANLNENIDDFIKSGKCVDGDFNSISDTNANNPTSCGLWTGKENTNYVYKITKYNTTDDIEGCPYFQSKGCYETVFGPRSPAGIYPGEVINHPRREVYPLEGIDGPGIYSPEVIDGPGIQTPDDINGPRIYPQEGFINGPDEPFTPTIQELPFNVAISREKWEQSTLATSLCKCAEIAKKEGKPFFSFNQILGKENYFLSIP